MKKFIESISLGIISLATAFFFTLLGLSFLYGGYPDNGWCFITISSANEPAKCLGLLSFLPSWTIYPIGLAIFAYYLYQVKER